MPGSVDATSKLASVVRGHPASGPVLGDDDRERVRFPSPGWGRAREHREVNRRDNPRHGSGRRVAAPLRPAGHAVDGKRKPGRAHARGRGAQCRFGKAPPSSSDRPPQGGWERVGRGSLPAIRSRPTSIALSSPTSRIPRSKTARAIGSGRSSILLTSTKPSASTWRPTSIRFRRRNRPPGDSSLGNRSVISTSDHLWVFSRTRESNRSAIALLHALKNVESDHRISAECGV